MKASTRSLRVKVTAEDVSKGARKQCYECPVAGALGRALPDDCEDVWVGTIWITWIRREKKFSHPVPPDARLAIQKFDRGGGMEPFEFALHASAVLDGRNKTR